MEFSWSDNAYINNKKYPILSIITPIYNRIRFIKNMMNSILYQNHKLDGLIEIILVDDNSDEKYSNLILRFIKNISRTCKISNKIINNFIFIYHRNKINKGEFANTNHGLKISKGTWKFILHDDDYVLPNFFKTISSYLKDNSDEYGFICFNYHNINNNKIIHHGRDLSLYKKINPDKKFQSLFLYNDPLHLHCLVYHKDVFKQIGFFSEGFKYYNVWEFHIRSNKFNLNWFYINKELVAYREHEEITRQTNLRKIYKNKNLKMFYSVAIKSLTNKQKKIFDIGIFRKLQNK